MSNQESTKWCSEVQPSPACLITAPIPHQFTKFFKMKNPAVHVMPC